MNAGNASVDALQPGFGDPVLDAQQTFRCLLEAMARPGRIVRVESPPPAPAPLAPALAAVCLTLFDHETPFWSDLDGADPALSWLRFHCGAPLTAVRGRACFAVVTRAGEFRDWSGFACGDAERPETSCTLIFEVKTLISGAGMRLTGPGIRTEAFLEIGGLDEGFWEARRRWCRAYPAGIDLIFCCGAHLTAIPRTVVVDADREL